MKKIIRESYISKIHAAFEKESLVLLTGPRQVGKTTLLQQYTDIYTTTHASAKAHYIDMQDRIGVTRTSHREFIERLLLEHNRDISQPGLLLLDEIQYLPFPESLLKFLYDLPDRICKIIATGSRFWGQQISGATLVGRGKEIRVRSFSFEEFLLAKGKNPKHIGSVSYQLLEKEIQEYLIYGGYPEVVYARSISEKIEIFDQIVKRQMERDFLTYVKGGSFVNFSHLMGYATRSIGSIWKHQSLAQSANIKTYEVKKYLEFLKDMFLLVPVTPFFKDKTKEYNAHNEYFMHDVGLISYFTDQRNMKEHKGKRIENFVLTHILREKSVREVHYRRTKNQTEIDFIVKGFDGLVLPVEVKSGEYTGSPRAFTSFIKKYKKLTSGYAVVACKNTKQVKTGNKNLAVQVHIHPYRDIGKIRRKGLPSKQA